MKNEMTIEDVAACLDGVGLQYLATIGLDGKPKVRPVQFMVLLGGKLWFCTNSEKAMYAELRASPFAELCGCRPREDEIASDWIRMSGEAVFPPESDETRAVKEAIVRKSAIVRELYKGAVDSPIFKVFHLANVRGALCNLGRVKGLENRPGFAEPAEFAF